VDFNQRLLYTVVVYVLFDVVSCIDCMSTTVLVDSYPVMSLPVPQILVSCLHHTVAMESDSLLQYSIFYNS